MPTNEYSITSLHIALLRDLKTFSRPLRDYPGRTDGLILNDLLYAGYIAMDRSGVSITPSGLQTLRMIQAAQDE